MGREDWPIAAFCLYIAGKNCVAPDIVVLICYTVPVLNLFAPLKRPPVLQNFHEFLQSFTMPL